MENQAGYSNGKFKLERIMSTYFMEDPEEIGRLGISGEKYDGSPVYYVKIGKNLGELIVNLLNDGRINHFNPKSKNVPVCAWEIKKRENQEKIVRHFGLDFLL